MKLYYYICDGGNFGDDLNVDLWNYFFQSLFDDDKNELFVGIGTILNKANLPDASTYHVFGSGYGYGEKPEIREKGKNWHFHFVRGPLTANALSLNHDIAITDPAILIKTFFTPKENTKKYQFSYIPHRRSAIMCDDTLKKILSFSNINYIDPRENYQKVFDEINASEIVLTEAMHGAICADALRVPWIPIKTHSFICDFKWHDWCQSMNMEYTPIKLPFVQKMPELKPSKETLKYVKNLVLHSKLHPAKAFEKELINTIKKHKPLLSEVTVHENAYAKVYDKVVEFRQSRK